ncbi:MAG: hypothetical protein HKO64_06695 [Xanthomonadales bacterium]|nr:hypothetical protein [Xanthomonadales bacterium]
MARFLLAFSTAWALGGLVASLFPAATGQAPELIIAGLVFAVCGWLAVSRMATIEATVYAVFCSGMTLAFSPAPWAGIEWLDTLTGLARSGVIFVSIAAALHLVLLIPWGSLKNKPPSFVPVYLPAVICWLLVTGRTRLDAAEWPLLNAFLLAVIGMLLAAYLLITTIAFLRRYIRSERRQRRRRGTRMMLWGSVLGTVPGLLAGFTLLGRLPGSRFLMLTAVLVPLSWYGVVRELARSGGSEHGNRGG